MNGRQSDSTASVVVILAVVALLVIVLLLAAGVFVLFIANSATAPPPIVLQPSVAEQVLETETKPTEQPVQPADKTSATEAAAWRNLFDGATLDGWEKTNYGGEGEVYVEEGAIVMEMGSNLTGITYTGELPTTNYELQLEGMRREGIDFFCTTTFPVGDSFCSLVVGGWAGGVVGLSNVDDKDASDNITTRRDIIFKNNQWYRIRIQVTDAKIECWIDDEQVVDLPREGHQFGIRPEVSLNRPLGISTWITIGAVREVRVRMLRDSVRASVGRR